MEPNSPADDTQSIHPASDPREIVRQNLQHFNEAVPRAERIGPYKILETLGEGGMGVVYLAEQTKPIHRRVALKIIKLGMDTKQVIARFETEREALALMNHPNVAKVFDAGVSEQGRPYFVMEFVAGIPITEYCDKHRLNTEERLRLFMDVCNAIQHAHQKGIIHRDIKPSNVLVSVDPSASTEPRGFSPRGAPPLDKGGLGGVAVKVIDFGVAKATQHRLTEQTLYTEQGQLIGTPGYMSPEQAEMTALDIDTRTDVYSLGVLLYELLVGAMPFDTRTLLQLGFAEIQRIIREVDPPKPSTRLSALAFAIHVPEPSASVDGHPRDESRGSEIETIAHRRHTEPKTLIRQIRGDLDWIVMRAMEKDRTRRYDTANGLAMEIQRYLSNEPVLAGPPGLRYRVRKLVRRKRGTVIASLGSGLALIAGLVGTSVMFVRAERAHRISVVERDRATAAEQDAISAKLSETQRAEQLRRTLYVSNIQHAQRAFDLSDVPRVRKLLDGCPEDLRGWEWYRLQWMIERSLLSLQGHEGDVFAVDLSPDQLLIASAGRDRTVRIWDCVTGDLLRTLHGHTVGVRTVRFCPKGESIASGDVEGRINVWDTRTGELRCTFEAHSDAVHDLAWIQDGQRLVSAGRDRVLRTWDVGTGHLLRTFLGHTDGIVSVAVAEGGSRIVSGSWDGTWKLWDAPSAEQVLSVSAGEAKIETLALSPDGERVATGHSDGQVRLWSAVTGKETLKLHAHRGAVSTIAFIPDGNRIVTGGFDRSVGIWDSKDGTSIARLFGHEGLVHSCVVSGDGKRVISGASDGTLRIWDAVTGQDALEVLSKSDSTFCPGTEWLYVVTSGRKETRQVSIWDTTTGDQIDERMIPGWGWAALSPDCSRVVLTDSVRNVTAPGSSMEWSLSILDTRTGESLVKFDDAAPSAFARPDVAFSVDGARFADWHDGRVNIFDTASATVVVTLEGEFLVKLEDGRFFNDLSVLAYEVSGKRVAAARLDGTIRIWDASTGKQLLVLAADAPISSLAFSPDGSRLASGEPNGRVTLWDTLGGSIVYAVVAPSGYIGHLAFSPDGSRLVSSGDDGSLTLWDASTGIEVLTFRAHQRPAHSIGVLSLAFSSDGTRIITSGTDGTIKVWANRPAPGKAQSWQIAWHAHSLLDRLSQETSSLDYIRQRLESDEVGRHKVRAYALRILESRNGG